MDTITYKEQNAVSLKFTEGQVVPAGKRLFVCLACEPNPDYLYSNWTYQREKQLALPDEMYYVEVANLSEARKVCREFIVHFDLGGGNWSGGRVIDESQNFVARISYNGRVWAGEAWDSYDEILIA